MSKIKKFLSRVLPSPARTFHKSIEYLSNHFSREIAENEETILSEMKSETDKVLSEMKSETNKVLSETKRVNRLFVGNTLYNSVAERERLIKFSFLEFRNRPDFEQCFFNLIADLDDESRRTIAVILKRMELIHGTEGTLDLFTYEEQQELRRQNQYLGKNILTVSDGCFCMGEFILPINKFNREVFFGRHGIDCVNYVDKIKNKHIIDGGAFIGDSLLILRSLTNKQVHCFEAMTEHYIDLEKTIKMNNIKNAVPVKKALGAEQSRINFILKGVGSHAVLSTEESTEEVDVISLDDYVAENNLEIGLIKVDIEGAEQDFLKGAKNTICKQKPVLIIAIDHNPEDFFFIKPELESWNLGYTFKIYKPVNRYVYYDTMLIAEVIE